MSTHAALLGAGTKVADEFGALMRDVSAAIIPPATKVMILRRVAAVLLANSHAHYMQAERLQQLANAIEAPQLSIHHTEEPHV